MAYQFQWHDAKKKCLLESTDSFLTQEEALLEGWRKAPPSQDSPLTLRLVEKRKDHRSLSETFGWHVSEENLKYLSCDKRLATFKNWPKIQPSAKALSESGFTYSSERDVTQCFSCGLKLSAWTHHDVPHIEHYFYQPHCKYLKLVFPTPERVTPRNSTLL